MRLLFRLAIVAVLSFWLGRYTFPWDDRREAAGDNLIRNRLFEVNKRTDVNLYNDGSGVMSEWPGDRRLWERL